MLILGIETSCDETAAAVVKFDRRFRFELLSSIVASQVNIHKQYGGVVPEVAARDHVLKIIPVVDKALKKSKVSLKEMDAIAVTEKPGLVTSLQVGINTAETLGFANKTPVIRTNHLDGHLVSGFISSKKLFTIPKSAFPLLALIVSGGHTQLVLMKDRLHARVVGETRDDAAGEAFDKTAKIMGIEYPGGPVISQYAKQGNPDRFDLPRPMMHSDDLDFSFSGLKTAVLYTVKGLPLKKDTRFAKKKTKGKGSGLSMNKKNMYDLSASIEQAIVDVLVHKTMKAAEIYGVKSIALAGGVAANNHLRKTLEKEAKNQKIDFFKPEKQFCTDNAAMIAVAGAIEAVGKSYV